MCTGSGRFSRGVVVVAVVVISAAEILPDLQCVYGLLRRIAFRWPCRKRSAACFRLRRALRRAPGLRRLVLLACALVPPRLPLERDLDRLGTGVEGALGSYVGRRCCLLGRGTF